MSDHPIPQYLRCHPRPCHFGAAGGRGAYSREVPVAAVKLLIVTTTRAAHTWLVVYCREPQSVPYEEKCALRGPSLAVSLSVSGSEVDNSDPIHMLRHVEYDSPSQPTVTDFPGAS